MATKTHTIRCKRIAGGKAEGEVLRSCDDICFFLTNAKSGKLFEKGHSLQGKSVAGKVLVFPSGKGSCVVQDEGLFALKEYGNLPSALIIESPDTVLVFGALLLELPVVSELDPSGYDLLKDGVHATVDAENGIVNVNDY